VPEAMKIQQNLNLGAGDVSKSLGTLTNSLTGLMLEGSIGKRADFVPSHMRNAWEWARNHGMFDFNEAVLAHEATKPNWQRIGEKAATVPMWLGEKMTRPPVFMWYADLFHRAGFEEAEAFAKAQEATDYAMANYHPDERPMMYGNLGTLGQFLGALATYKHNLIDQYYTRAKDVGKGEIAPAAVMLGLGYALYGLTGVPFYQEADNITRWLTGKSIRHFGEKIIQDPSMWDGALSATTGYDFNSRLSMASVIPDDPLSAAPHISNTVRIVGAAIEYAKTQDKTSLYNLGYQATPAGMRGLTEAKTRRDADGYVLEKNVQRKYDTPRTADEWKVRATTGIRPLRERLTDEKNFGNLTKFTDETKKLQTIERNVAKAILNQDEAGITKHIQDYVANKGDPTVFSDTWIEKVLIEGAKSQKQRLEGIPGDNIRSINRYNAYQD
jgi:hypothetical protein